VTETLPEFGSILNGTDLSDRYRIIAPLAKGSMGIVYRGLQRDLGREVAIKIIGTRHIGDEEARGRFSHEMQVMARLTHPHIATVLDAGISVTGHAFYVMELLYGDTVAERLATDGQQSPSDATRIITQILHGVCEAHRFGIVHRDLKPSNIVLCAYATQDDWVKIVDFGLAHPFQPQSGCDYVALKDVPSGTIAYMAPEQLRCLQPTPAMDTYAVGHILAELLLGHTPYHGMSATEVIRAKLGDARYPFSSPILLGPLGSVVARAVANDPKDRYPSAEAMLDALQTTTGSVRRRLTEANHAIPHPTATEIPVIIPEILTRTRG
jgi:serine/threonine-protein kinase